MFCLADVDPAWMATEQPPKRGGSPATSSPSAPASWWRTTGNMTGLAPNDGSHDHPAAFADAAIPFCLTIKQATVMGQPSDDGRAEAGRAGSYRLVPATEGTCCPDPLTAHPWPSAPAR